MYSELIANSEDIMAGSDLSAFDRRTVKDSKQECKVPLDGLFVFDAKPTLSMNFL